MKSDNEIDLELLENAKCGKQQSFESLLKKYKPIIIGIARKYFLIGAEIEDLVQEGDIGFFQAFCSYDKKKMASFKTFAIMCITRQIQSAIKMANRKKHFALNNIVYFDFLNESNEEDLFFKSEELSPEDIVISEENQQYIKEEIEKKLSKFELKILKEFLKGKSYSQIAQIGDCTTKSVENALSRIRTKLNYLLFI